MSARSLTHHSRLLASGATALVIAAAVPLLPGASAAWACGGDDASARGSSASAQFGGNVQEDFVPPVPGTITAGGPMIEIGVEMVNFSGVTDTRVAPTLAFDNLPASSHPGGGTNLRPEDFTVEVMTGGQWKKLPMRHGCDPVIHADTSILNQKLDNDRAARFLFRVGLSAEAPADQKEITVFSGQNATGQVNRRTLRVLRPTTPTGTPTRTAGTSAPTAGAPTAATPAAVPAAATSPAAVSASTSPAAVAVSTAATPATGQLASTGADGSSTLLLGAGGALVVLGAAAVFAAQRRRPARH